MESKMPVPPVPACAKNPSISLCRPQPPEKMQVETILLRRKEIKYNFLLSYQYNTSS